MDCFNKKCDYSKSNVCENCNAIKYNNCTGRVKHPKSCDECAWMVTSFVIDSHCIGCPNAYPKKKKLSWKDILYAHAFINPSVIWRMSELAKELGYKYFCWNDSIYQTSDGSDTGLTIKDVV